MVDTQDKQSMMETKIRLEALSDLLVETSKLESALKNKLEHTDKINSILLEGFKTGKIDYEKLKELKVGDLKITKVSLKNSIKNNFTDFFKTSFKNEKNETVSFTKGIKNNFDAFFRWKKDDYDDLKKKKLSPKMKLKRYFSWNDEDGSKNKTKDETKKSKAEDKDEDGGTASEIMSVLGLASLVPIAILTAKITLLTVTLGAVGGMLYTNAKNEQRRIDERNEIKAKDKTKRETYENEDTTVKRDNDNQYKNIVPRVSTLSDMSVEIIQKQSDEKLNVMNKTDKAMSGYSGKNTSVKSVNKKLQSFKSALQDPSSVDDNYKTATPSSTLLGLSIDYSKIQIEDGTDKIKVTRKVSVEQSGGATDPLMGKSYARPRPTYTEDNTTFTHTQFIKLFEELITPKVQWYYSTYDMKQWKIDVEQVRQQILWKLGLTAIDKDMLNLLYDLAIKDIKLDTVDDNDIIQLVDDTEVILKNLGQTDEDIIQRYNTKDYNTLKNEVNNQSQSSKTVTLDVFDNNDYTNFKYLLQYYYKWELNVISRYMSWGITKKSRIAKLEKEFDRFWIQMLKQIAIKDKKSAYKLIYIDKFLVFKSNLIKNDKSQDINSIFDLKNLFTNSTKQSDIESSTTSSKPFESKYNTSTAVGITRFGGKLADYFGGEVVGKGSTITGDNLPIASNTAYVSSGFQQVRYLPQENGTSVKNIHMGIDITGEEGMPIRAVWSGIVVAVVRDKKNHNTTKGVVSELNKKDGNGNYVSIRTTIGGYLMLYKHLDTVESWVKEGVSVKAGEVIGTMGSTGFSTGRHLHFEVQKNGQSFNPTPFFAGENIDVKTFGVTKEGNYSVSTTSNTKDVTPSNAMEIADEEDDINEDAIINNIVNNNQEILTIQPLNTRDYYDVYY